MRYGLVLVLFLASISGYSQELKKEYISPKNGYTEVVAYTSGNVKTIYVSGQIGEGDSLDEQIRSAMTNLKMQLELAGAGLVDLVKINTYIVDYKQEDLDIFRKAREDIFGDIDRPASTLVGVTALALDGWLVEIDGVAVIEVK
jgi:enamine deaminase RidA (YjgF/YER057c/UK114 family)